MNPHRASPGGHSAPRGHPGPRWPGTPRDEVLARIRAALGPGPAGESGADSVTDAGPPPAPGYRTLGDLDETQRLDLLAERLADYRAAVRRTTRPELAATAGAALAERGVRRVVIPAGLDLLVVLRALPPGVDVVIDDDLSPQYLDTIDGVITGAAVAIAETGTIVLDGSPDQGRRAITLVPTTTCAWCAPTRLSDWCPRRSTGWRRGPASPSPGSAGRPRPATSSCRAWRACTAPARWR